MILVVSDPSLNCGREYYSSVCVCVRVRLRVCVYMYICIYTYIDTTVALLVNMIGAEL